MTKHSEHRVYEFGEFRLDALYRMLYRHGEEISLPPKAVETLLALVERNGEIVHTDELMKTIWTDSVVDESNLSQYLHLLRKTLGNKNDGTPFIETLRRRGYRFSSDKIIKSAKTLSALIGRETEIAKIVELLKREDVRLVTMTGVGGVGKTTLSQSVIAQISDYFSDGVYFIELAPVTNPKLIASTIASNLGIREAGDTPIFEALKDYLREREILLVIDNFEQVADGAQEIAGLLKSSKNLKILVTSRVLLHLSAEVEFIVPPLAVPSEKLLGDYAKTGAVEPEIFDDLSKYEAVQLFVSRAQKVKPAFSVTTENISKVAEICTKLDGLPLAIELAAARIKFMSPRSILAKLESQLNLLTGGARDLPARQQTIRGTISWSYDLLEENERRLFERLGIFAGGFTLEAAEKVAGESENSSFSTLDSITSLIEQSLLVSNETADGDVRFRMLEVVREYALEALEKSGELETMQQNHAGYYLEFAKAAEPHLQRAQSADWLNRLEEELDNLRNALQWSIKNDVRLGQFIIASIWRFWLLHGHIREGCEQLNTFLSQEVEGDKAIRIKMLLGAGFLNRLKGDFALTQSCATESLALAKEIGDKKGVAFSLYLLGLLALNDDISQAENLFEKGLGFAKESEDKHILALLFNGLGELARSQADYQRASEFYRQALIINQEIGDLPRQVTNLINLGATELSQKDYESADSFYRKGLQISSKMGDVRGGIYCLEGIAGAYWARCDAKQAALLLGAAESLRETNNLPLEPADRLPYDQSVNLVHNLLGEELFTDLFTKGQKLTFEKAVEIVSAKKPDLAQT